jgi:hypothetical protein
VAKLNGQEHARALKARYIMNVLANGTPAVWLRWAVVSRGNGTQSALPLAKTTRRRIPPTPFSNVSSGTAVPAAETRYSIRPLAPEDELQLKNVPVGNVVS